MSQLPLFPKVVNLLPSTESFSSEESVGNVGGETRLSVNVRTLWQWN